MMVFDNILTITTTILAAWLLFLEFSTFLFVKPTLTSLEQSSQKKEYFPVVIICPEPAFNLKSLKEEDYEGVFQFQFGNTDWKLDRTSLKMKNFNFWGGKSNISQSKLYEKVALAPNSSDWISAMVKYDKDNGRAVGQQYL